MDEPVAKLHTLLQNSREAAQTVASAWSLSTANGGIPAKTYRDLCANSGNDTNLKSGRDFNRELLGTVLTDMDPTWTSVMSVQVPGAISACNTILGTIITQYCQCVADLLDACLGSPVESPPMINDQIAQLQDVVWSTVHTQVHALYRKTPRLSLDKFRTAMAPCYQRCAAQHGTSCRVGMAQIMVEYLRANGAKIFGDIEAATREQLADMHKTVMQDLEREFEARLEHITGLYNGILPAEPEGARRAKKLLLKLLTTADQGFALSTLERRPKEQLEEAPEPSLADVDGEE
ncbi:hypothetical protein Sste5346_005665 [Sporothrix stenoceras]|uniref:DUF7605 domain-containing protein n=1 Tax=Sporothrix stenoceras TaxID=5173 RepID=A0ABR3Z364_9PEZI